MPIAAVQTPAEALTSEHLRAVGALAPLPMTGGGPVTVPVGPFVVDGAHRGLSGPAAVEGAAPAVAGPDERAGPTAQERATTVRRTARSWIWA